MLARPARRRTRAPTPPTRATRRSRRSPRAARCRASCRIVRLLPNHWWDSSWATSRSVSQSSLEEVGAEDRQPLRLERDLEVVVGDHRRCTAPRTGRGRTAGRRRSSSRPAGRTAASERSRIASGNSDLDRDRRVGERGAPRSGRSARSRGRSPSARPARSARSSCSRRGRWLDAARRCADDVVAVRRGERDRRYDALSDGPVVAREPGRRAVRLRRRRSRRRRAPPSRRRRAGRRHGAGLAAVGDRDRKLVAGGGRALGGGCSSRSLRWAYLAGRGAVDGHLRRPRRPAQVEDEPVGVLAAAAAQDRPGPRSRLPATS